MPTAAQHPDTAPVITDSPWLNLMTTTAESLIVNETTYYLGIESPLESPKIYIESVKD